MKVLISAYRCNPKEGGEPYRSLTWIRHYIQEGFEVVCLTNRKDRKDLENIAHQFPGCQFVYLEIPEFINRLYVNMVGVYIHYLAWQHYAIREAKKLHKEHNFNFVHHTCYGSPQLGSGMWQLGIPFIYGPLGGGQFPPKAFKQYFHEGWSEEVYRFWISKLLMWCNPNAGKALKAAAVVIAENFETRDLAVRCGATNIKIFLDAEVPRQQEMDALPLKTSKELRILWIGRLLHRKGLPLALEAVSLLKDKIDFKLTIIGDGPANKYLTEWLKDHNKDQKVEWLGQIPWKDIKDYYQNNDIFLFTSLRDSSGAQLFEAMTYGLPIVTLDHFGAKALLPDDVCIKVPVSRPQETVQAIAEAISFYYHNEETRIQHGNKAIHYMKYDYCKNVPLLIQELKMDIPESISSSPSPSPSPFPSL